MTSFRPPELVPTEHDDPGGSLPYAGAQSISIFATASNTSTNVMNVVVGRSMFLLHSKEVTRHWGRIWRAAAAHREPLPPRRPLKPQSHRDRIHGTSVFHHAARRDKPAINVIYRSPTTPPLLLVDIGELHFRIKDREALDSVSMAFSLAQERAEELLDNDWFIPPADERDRWTQYRERFNQPRDEGGRFLERDL